jgi:hypothetical protein
MRDQAISDWLKITPSESEMLERLPPAGLRHEKPTRESMASIQASVAERRKVIRATIADLGYLPNVRLWLRSWLQRAFPPATSPCGGTFEPFKPTPAIRAKRMQALSNPNYRS